MKVSAKYELKLPGHLLFMRSNEHNDSIVIQHTHDQYNVIATFTLDTRTGLSGKNIKTTYASNEVTVVVSKEEENVPTFGKKNVAERHRYFTNRYRVIGYANAAITTLNAIINYFKYELGQPLLNEIDQYGHDFDNPIWEDESGNILNREFRGGYIHFGSGAQVLSKYKKFDIRSYNENVDLKKLQKTLKKPYAPKLHEEILLDSKSAIVQENYRRAILEMAIACEIFVKNAFFKDKKSNDLYNYLEEKRKIEISIPELLHKAAKKVFGESFKEADKTHFDNINHLFRARNKIAHLAQCYYKDDAGKKHLVNEKTLSEWWRSIHEVISWINRVSEE